MTPETGRRATTGQLLARAIAELDGRYETSGSACLGDVLAALGPRAGALGAALLALPLVSPMNLGPVTLAASAAIGLLGLGMLRRGDPPPLPARLLAVPVPRPVFRVMRAMLARLSRWIERPQPARTAAWYAKRTPTFSDALAAVRAHWWRWQRFRTSPREADMVKLPRHVVRRLSEAACYAA